MRMVRTAGPRGGSLGRGRRLLILPCLLCLAACQTTAPQWVDYPAAVRFSADGDSLGLAEFMALPAAARAERATAAERWHAQAVAAGTVTDALRCLHTAVGLAPTNAAAWLELAQRRRWYGDYQQTEDALTAFRRAAPPPSRSRQDLAARAAILEAWLRYDRGEWNRGLAAADSAQKFGAAGDEVDLIRALHLAGLGRYRRAEDIAFRFAGRDHRAHWIYGISYWRRGGVQAAHGIFTGTAREILSGTDDFVKGPMRPVVVGASECYRDFGTVEELLGNEWLARRNYRDAAGHVPWRDPAALERRDHPNLARGRLAETMPVWLAFDRYYVTGSLSAYTALALQRFEAAQQPDDRAFWAAAVIDAAGSCLRLDIHAPWAQRARGLVLATYADQRVRARRDLDEAQQWFDRHRIEDLPTLTTLGRLSLEQNRPARAQTLLERALKLSPQEPQLWSDFALACIHLGHTEPAMAALARALELDDTLAVAWYNRGLLRFHLDDVIGAIADLERAHALAPDDRTIAGLLEQLRRRIQP